MPMRKTQPVVLAMPEGFKVINGINPGELELSVDRMKGVTSYNFQYSYDMSELATWTTVSSSTATLIIPGLKTGL